MRLFEVAQINEDRADYVSQTFGDKLIAAWNSLYPSMPQTKPEGIVAYLRELDPTPNKKFLVWIASLLANRKLDPKEDGYKLSDYIPLFVQVQQRLNKRDIMQYRSLPELAAVLRPFEENPEAAMSGKAVASAEREELFSSGQAERILKKDGITIVSPKTKEAACELGKGTEWCTSATKSHNAFEEYNRTGPLYIIYGPKTRGPWQFHFQTGQFTDVHDSPLSADDILSESVVADFFAERIANGTWIEEAMDSAADGYGDENQIHDLASDFNLCQVVRKFTAGMCQLRRDLAAIAETQRRIIIRDLPTWSDDGVHEELSGGAEFLSRMEEAFLQPPFSFLSVVVDAILTVLINADDIDEDVVYSAWSAISDMVHGSNDGLKSMDDKIIQAFRVSLAGSEEVDHSTKAFLLQHIMGISPTEANQWVNKLASEQTED